MEDHKGTASSRLSASEDSRPDVVGGDSAARDHSLSLPGGGTPLRGCLKSPSSATPATTATTTTAGLTSHTTTTTKRKSVRFAQSRRDAAGNTFVSATCLTSGKEVLPGRVIRSLTSLQLVQAPVRTNWILYFGTVDHQLYWIGSPASGQRLVVTPEPVTIWDQRRPRSPPPAHSRPEQQGQQLPEPPRPYPRLYDGRPAGPLFR